MRTDASHLGLIPAAVFATVLALAGCSDGVELNGKIFDAVGVGTNSKKAEEVKLESRVPLVPPPKEGQLPVPGETTTNAHMAWPTDPDLARKQAALTAAQKKKQDCDYQRKFGSADDKRGDVQPNPNCGSVWDFINPNASTPQIGRPTEQAIKQMPR